MPIEVHTIQFAGGRRVPPGTELEVRRGSREATVRIRLKFPGQDTYKDLGDLPIVDGVVELPVKMVFLCHASEDLKWVQRTSEMLEQNGCLTWLSTKDLLGGDDWKREIDLAIAGSDYVLLFLSKSSVGQPGYFNREIRYALEQAALRPIGDRFIIPIRIDDAGVPPEFESLHWLSMRDPDWFGRLLTALG